MKFSVLPYFVLFTIFFAPKITQSQERDKQAKDSVRERATKGIKEKFPSTRILNFEYGQSFNRSMDSKLFEEDFNQGKIKNQSNFKGAINFPVFIKGGFSLLASGRYAYHRFDFSDFDDLSDTQVFEKQGREEFHYFTTALSATYFQSFLTNRLSIMLRCFWMVITMVLNESRGLSDFHLFSNKPKERR